MKCTNTHSSFGINVDKINDIMLYTACFLFLIVLIGTFLVVSFNIIDGDNLQNKNSNKIKNKSFDNLSD